MGSDEARTDEHHGVEVDAAHHAAYFVAFLCKVGFPARVLLVVDCVDRGVLLSLGACPRQGDGGDESRVPGWIRIKVEELLLCVRISAYI